MLLPVLFSSDFSSFDATPAHAGRGGQGPGMYPGLPVPSQTQHGGTAWQHPRLVPPCSAQPQHMLRGRNPPTDTLLFIQAINNSHKNPLPNLFVLSQTLPMGKETTSILWAAGSRLCIFLACVIPQVPSSLFFFNSLLIHIPPSQVKL